MNKEEADRALDNLIHNGLTRAEIDARLDALDRDLEGRENGRAAESAVAGDRRMNEDRTPGMVYLVVLEFEDIDGVSDAYWSYKHECDIYERVAGVFDSEQHVQRAVETQLRGLTPGETMLDGRLVLGGYVMAMPFNRFAQGGWVRSL